MRIVSNVMLLFIVLSIFSCGQQQVGKSPQSDAALALLQEADSLMRADTLFWNAPVNRDNPVVCRYDSLVRSKLDDALLMAPSLKNAYTLRFVYLMRSWKLDDVLSLLRKMEANVPDSMAADMWNLKAMLEDRAGFADTANHDFRKADSLYGMQLKQCENSVDSVRYAMLRLMKALNFSIWSNDFNWVRNEVKLYNKVHLTPLENTETLNLITGKEDYYRYLFGED